MPGFERQLPQIWLRRWRMFYLSPGFYLLSIIDSNNQDLRKLGKFIHNFLFISLIYLWTFIFLDDLACSFLLASSDSFKYSALYGAIVLHVTGLKCRIPWFRYLLFYRDLLRVIARGFLKGIGFLLKLCCHIHYMFFLIRYLSSAMPYLMTCYKNRFLAWTIGYITVCVEADIAKYHSKIMEFIRATLPHNKVKRFKIICNFFCVIWKKKYLPGSIICEETIQSSRHCCLCLSQFAWTR